MPSRMGRRQGLGLHFLHNRRADALIAWRDLVLGIRQRREEAGGQKAKLFNSMQGLRGERRNLLEERSIGFRVLDKALDDERAPGGEGRAGKRSRLGIAESRGRVRERIRHGHIFAGKAVDMVAALTHFNSSMPDGDASSMRSMGSCLRVLRIISHAERLRRTAAS